MNKAVHEFEACNVPDGFTIDSIETDLCKCTWVEIQDENGEEAMGKSVGNYVTIETSILENGQRGNLDEIAKNCFGVSCEDNEHFGGGFGLGCWRWKP